MEPVTAALLLAIAVIAAAVLQNVLSDEVSAWLRHLADRIVARAAARTGDPGRWLDPWLAELDFKPGAAVSKVGWALSTYFGAASMRRTRPPLRQALMRVADKAAWTLTGVRIVVTMTLMGVGVLVSGFAGSASWWFAAPAFLCIVATGCTSLIVHLDIRPERARPHTR